MEKPHPLPTLAIIAALAGAALYYGPIAQWPDYHRFADQQTLLGILHFADVVSNLGFLGVALWGATVLGRCRAAYRLFLIGLFLTAFGSAWYHLAPDNARLVWDRLPIALTCAGLLAGVWGDTWRRPDGAPTVVLGLLAAASVAWWYASEQAGHGDLRPYLLFQALPMLLIPLWQSQSNAPRAERWSFAAALLLYATAKLAEMYDHEIAAALGGLSGHTAKHLLATAAAAVIVGTLIRRNRTPSA